MQAAQEEWSPAQTARDGETPPRAVADLMAACALLSAVCGKSTVIDSFDPAPEIVALALARGGEIEPGGFYDWLSLELSGVKVRLYLRQASVKETVQ
jgi:hypothetical protein